MHWLKNIVTTTLRQTAMCMAAFTSGMRWCATGQLPATRAFVRRSGTCHRKPNGSCCWPPWAPASILLWELPDTISRIHFCHKVSMPWWTGWSTLITHGHLHQVLSLPPCSGPVPWHLTDITLQGASTVSIHRIPGTPEAKEMRFQYDAWKTDLSRLKAHFTGFNEVKEHLSIGKFKKFPAITHRFSYFCLPDAFTGWVNQYEQGPLPSKI